jgi:hypothetical protein
MGTATEISSGEDSAPILIIKTERNSKTEFHKFKVGDQIGDVIVDEIVSLTATQKGLLYIVQRFTNIPLAGVGPFTWYGDYAKMIYHYLAQTQMK